MSRRHGRGGRDLQFSRGELLDLLVAWVALGVAFAIFLAGGGFAFLRSDPLSLLVVSLLTAGIGFLLHELAHKVVAVRFGQVAQFRADYGMLFLAVATALAGFLFAAPGAVYHRGRLTDRQQGLVSLAGPVTNLGLAVLFLPLLAVPVEFVSLLGTRGVQINLLLAAFNMLPYGPLDGRSVLSWSKAVWLVVFAPSALLALGVFFLSL